MKKITVLKYKKLIKLAKHEIKQWTLFIKLLKEAYEKSKIKERNKRRGKKL